MLFRFENPIPSVESSTQRGHQISGPGLCGKAEGTSLGEDAQEPSAASTGHARPPGEDGERDGPAGMILERGMVDVMSTWLFDPMRFGQCFAITIGSPTGLPVVHGQ